MAGRVGGRQQVGGTHAFLPVRQPEIFSGVSSASVAASEFADPGTQAFLLVQQPEIFSGVSSASVAASEFADGGTQAFLPVRQPEIFSGVSSPTRTTIPSIQSTIRNVSHSTRCARSKQVFNLAASPRLFGCNSERIREGAITLPIDMTRKDAHG
jgi:hypothetical protein